MLRRTLLGIVCILPILVAVACGPAPKSPCDMKDITLASASVSASASSLPSGKADMKTPEGDDDEASLPSPNAPMLRKTERSSAEVCPSGMTAVPAGTFSMGSEDRSEEKPPHEVSIESFCMDPSEVTVEAYAACIKAGKCTAPGVGEACNLGKTGRSKHPINCVDFHQANAFCKYTEKRLPTEEEWEYAARGSAGRKYPWGSEAPSSQLCWKRSDKSGTCEVRSFPQGRSPFALFDLAGNVAEWTSSGYSPNYDSPRRAGTYIVRGGGYADYLPGVVRTAERAWSAASVQNPRIGFRCAK